MSAQVIWFDCPDCGNKLAAYPHEIRVDDGGQELPWCTNYRMPVPRSEWKNVFCDTPYCSYNRRHEDAADAFFEALEAGPGVPNQELMAAAGARLVPYGAEPHQRFPGIEDQSYVNFDPRGTWPEYPLIINDDAPDLSVKAEPEENEKPVIAPEYNPMALDDQPDEDDVEIYLEPRAQEPVAAAVAVPAPQAQQAQQPVQLPQPAPTPARRPPQKYSDADIQLMGDMVRRGFSWKDIQAQASYYHLE